uniref:Cartilage acidic protein 1 n=1 Tax=Gasterosteus aculeatus aculeatus TaxID=481459 RepID=A0AAQ4RAD2_GASAC
MDGQSVLLTEMHYPSLAVMWGSGVLLLLVGLWYKSHAQSSEPMFQDVTQTMLPPDSLHNPTQLNYGMAVTDVDGDGDLEVIVAGYNGPNLVLKYSHTQKRLVNIAVDDSSSPYFALRDQAGNAIGVTACDVDGDGREEIYFLNTNNAYSGRATYSDKLFKFRNGRFEDLLGDELNVRRGVANGMAGRSVACVDRKGTGRYSIYLANYASGNVGPHALLEMDEAASDVPNGIIALSDVAATAGVNKLTGRHGRGVALADFNGDGKTDIVYGNWNGPHRLFLQGSDSKFRVGKVEQGRVVEDLVRLTERCLTVFPLCRTLPLEDSQPPHLFAQSSLLTLTTTRSWRCFSTILRIEAMPLTGSSDDCVFVCRVSRRAGADPLIQELHVGDAAEPQGRGTGGTVTDLDGDGQLDLLLAHGESFQQPISIFKVTQGSSNNWLRVVPRTQFGSFARGATVTVFTSRSGAHTRIIDGGSGYLCEMEPVAHFGLGSDQVTALGVSWPDGSFVTRTLQPGEMNSVVEVPYPKEGESSLLANETQVQRTDPRHEL